MRQTWRDLLFLHWRWEVSEIASRLPQGLTVQEFDGSAWIGLVAFRMEDIRLLSLPPIPFVSAFPELNLRTYVQDRQGRPGVWFFSLDAGHPLAVWAARTFFHLPYFTADMHARIDAQGFVRYESHRKGTPGDREVRLRYKAVGEPRTALEGSLEAFLCERYRLFSSSPSQGLLTGRVWHEPYTLQEPAVTEWDDHLFELDDFPRPGRPPDHAIFSPGVSVETFALRPVDSVS